MIVQTKPQIFIRLDEDEAEDFLDDATALQTRVREQLRATQRTATPSAAVPQFA